jgi:hypothetical protein
VQLAFNCPLGFSWRGVIAGFLIGIVFISTVVVFKVRHGQPVAVLSSRQIDFGTISATSRPRVGRIDVENRGSAELEIAVVGTSCGCARVVELDDRIAPGGKGRLLIEVNPSASQSGLNIQHLTIKTNAKGSEYIVARIEWRIRQDADVVLTPSEVQVTVTRAELAKSAGAARHEIIIMDRWAHGPLQINHIATSKYVSATVEKVDNTCVSCQQSNPGTLLTRAFRCRIILSSELPSPSIDEWVLLTTNHPTFSVLKVRITGSVLTEMVPEPSQIVIDSSRFCLKTAF